MRIHEVLAHKPSHDVVTVKPDGTRVYTTMRGVPKANAPIPAPPVVALEEK